MSQRPRHVSLIRPADMSTYVLLQEEKWKREQAAAKEKQKAEELKKQIVEEREHEELDALAHAAGIKQCAFVLLKRH